MASVDISRVLGGALLLARDGRRCFPCLANKHPATPHGFKDASSDPEKVRALWRRYPGPVIGVATGEAADIDVLDLDSKHREAVEWLRENRHRLPLTRLHRTRSGGLHFLFQHAPGMRSWAGRPVRGVDGRGDGGYVVWWPATCLPVLSDMPPAPWPRWLLAELRPSRSLPHARVATIPDEHALAGLVRKIARAEEGERNSLAFWAACRAGEMAASGLIGADTAAAVIANAAMLSGLPPAEAERTARSGVRTGLASALHA
jgi:hypothetical protein